MASTAAIRRRGSANNARIAAKQRRQKILVGVLVAVLAVLLACEVPHLLNRSSGSSSAAVPAAPAASTPKHVSRPGGGSGADPFAAKSLPNGDAHAVAGGGPDPFTPSSASSSSSAASSTAALPRRIVIGRPGGHRVAKRGWIVILASIPTRNGRPAALSFAHGARRSRRRGLGPQLFESPAAARRLLGRLHRALLDADGGLATRGQHPRGRLPLGLHPRAHLVQVTTHST